MKLALHTCCGPCLIEPYDDLAGDFEEIVIVFANPNIHPAEEYERRRQTLASYAERLGVGLVEVDYDPALWIEACGPYSRDAEARCRACYRLRLQLVARWAVEHDIDAMATTLTVSPYQDAAVISEEGRAAADDAGIEYLERDYRERYREATTRSRELGMYRQNYCGCLMSEIEARRERERRRPRSRRPTE